MNFLGQDTLIIYISLLIIISLIVVRFIKKYKSDVIPSRWNGIIGWINIVGSIVIMFVALYLLSK